MLSLKRFRFKWFSSPEAELHMSHVISDISIALLIQDSGAVEVCRVGWNEKLPERHTIVQGDLGRPGFVTARIQTVTAKKMQK